MPATARQRKPSAELVEATARAEKAEENYARSIGVREELKDWLRKERVFHANAIKECNDKASQLHESLGDVIGILARIGGYLTAEDQKLLCNARRVHGGA